MKDKERIKGIVEAILFTMGESVALSRLAEVLEVEEEALKDLLEEMKGDYAGKDRGICLIELDGAYQICTKIETYEYVKKLVSQPKKRSLTDVMLETLSIVAYKQPVTNGKCVLSLGNSIVAITFRGLVFLRVKIALACS